MVIEELQVKKQNGPYSLPYELSASPVQLFLPPPNGTSTPQISVIMPALNEEKAIGPLLDRTQQTLQQMHLTYEIIVIDDGSRDQTLDICRGKCVTIIHNRYNCGKGYALREGFKHARGEIILTIDTDGDHHPEEIPLLLAPLLDGKVDAVLGSRFITNGSKPVTSAVNSFGNKFFNFVVRGLTNHNFTDTQCGFRAFKKFCLSILSLETFGYDLETETVVKLARRDIPYCEVPVTSPVSSIRKSNLIWIKDGLRILFTILKTRLKKSI